MNDYAHVMNDDEDEYDREYDRTAQLVELGQGNRAVDVLTSLLAHYPEYEGNTRILLAFAHMRADHVDDAVTSARAAVRLLPQEPEAHRVLGQALACLGDEAAAEHSLRTCLALNPHNAEAHSLIGGLLAEAKRHEEAIVHAREAVRLEPDNPRHHYTLGCANSPSCAPDAETTKEQPTTSPPSPRRIPAAALCARRSISSSRISSRLW